MEAMVVSPQLAVKLARWNRWVRSTLPVIGWVLRALAIRGLCACREAMEAMDGLAAALASGRRRLAERARVALEGLPMGPLQDALCEMAMREPTGAVAQLCMAQGYRPRDEERAALFLFVTRQFDAYFEHDDGFDMLRREYDRAESAVQGHVMEVLRSGDRRCLGFFGARKKLSECSDLEIRVALDSALKHGDWPRLWKAFTEMPLRFGVPLLGPLGSSGWKPANERESTLFGEVQRLAAADGGAGISLPDGGGRGGGESGDGRPKATSTVFDSWLKRGSSPRYANRSTGELLASLRSAPPPEAVSLVAAMAAKGRLEETARAAIEKHPHWLVRLAGHVTGALGMDLTRDQVDDPVHWVREVVDAADVLKLWPVKATPADLEALEGAPAKAWSGKLGTARRLLRALMVHRLDTGVWEEVFVEHGEFAGEFERVGGGLEPA